MNDKKKEAGENGIEKPAVQMEEKKDAGAQGHGRCGFVAPACAIDSHVWDNFRH